MFRNLAAAAWRGANRDRLHTALNLFGLALGFAAAILIGLLVRDELSYNRFIPDYPDVARIQMTFHEHGRSPATVGSTMHRLPAELAIDFPEVQATARVASQRFGLRRGDVESVETGQAADGSFITVLGWPLLRGDPATALTQPNSVVLSKDYALKYFGTIDCIGEAMEIDRAHPVRVTGVLADEPEADLKFEFNVLLSGSSSFSRLAQLDEEPPPRPGDISTDVDTFVRLRPGTDIAALRDRLDAFVVRHYPPTDSDPDLLFRLWLRPVAEEHLYFANPDVPDRNGDVATLWAIAATGTLILLVAGINFVNLVTARATRRAVEVGVRKALGATRLQLVLQFMGEAVASSLLSLVLAIAAVELVLPSFNAFLRREIGFEYWHDPALSAAMVATAILFGVAAGLYPALVQSSFRPAATLKARGAGTPGSVRLRQVLVVLQFAVSIGLLIGTAVIYRQTDYATTESLRFDTDQIVTVELDAINPSGSVLGGTDVPTLDTLKSRFANTLGVRAVAGSWVVPNTRHMSQEEVRRSANSDLLAINVVPVDFGFFELYGIKPVAGRSFDKGHGDDTQPIMPKAGAGTAIINESAVKALGFASPEAAIGQSFLFTDPADPGQTRTIVGVVPDMQMATARSKIPPTAYLAAPSWDLVLSLKLDGHQVPETLHRIDQVWHEIVPARPIERSFLDERIDKMYLDLHRKGEIFAIFALVAVAIGSCGLFGLSAFTAERRTKEIGVRKALGASTADVLRLLIWQFVQPVAIANVIAWPLAWLVMQRWLDGFAYRIALGPLLFLAAGAFAFAVAIGTTAFHALQVARSRPVAALRYE